MGTNNQQKPSNPEHELTEQERALIEKAKGYEHFSMEFRQNRELYLLIAKLARMLGL